MRWGQRTLQRLDSFVILSATEPQRAVCRLAAYLSRTGKQRRPFAVLRVTGGEIVAVTRCAFGGGHNSAYERWRTEIGVKPPHSKTTRASRSGSPLCNDSQPGRSRHYLVAASSFFLATSFLPAFSVLGLVSLALASPSGAGVAVTVPVHSRIAMCAASPVRWPVRMMRV
jgi:hypothetical protein